ncbi:FtsW/RodA/SpoVE family cell cycle protein [Bacillus sp. FJAT-29814]|uniref:FtsW/RodA/SpoVE family cell cycle protein n=1 Tax=Bacillus sp. FJAT-29814 TaxID=1729688 RepID=UPI0008318A2F|nr:FtsW/RodA/SpoVE family cell cycle protein [Bacillus sp. FJAT-29814]
MNKRHVFITEVINHIKSKEAKKYVAEELTYHIKEAKKGWLEKGLTESQAEEKAVQQMGSPGKLGEQLSRLHRPKVDWILIGLLVMAFGLGFMPLISLGYIDERYFSISKLITVLLGGAAAVGLMFFDYRKWKKLGWLFYLVGIFILIILRFFASTMINGTPVLRIPSILTIESTMAIPFLFFAWAAFFNSERLKVWQFIPLFSIPLSLFVTMPSMVNTYIYTVMVFVMMWWSKFNRKIVIAVWTAIAGGVAVLVISFWSILKSYQKTRLLAFFYPENDPNGAGYLYSRMHEILTKATWFGNAGRKEFIPEAHTDFVFVSFAYHYGWMFAIVLVLILTLLAVRMVAVSFKIKDSYGKLLLIGALALYIVQLATHLAISFGVFPIISISLPFISYGLMPTLVNAILIGVVLSVYRRKDFILTY